MLVELREHTLTGGHDLLYGNCLELSSQSAMFQRDFSRAAEFLEKGLCVFGEKKNIYEFFVRKDQAFLRLLNEGPNAAALDELAGIRREAETLGHWESIRDCDFYRAVAEQDDRLLNHVWYGTPFASYREKMVEMYGSPVQISRSHVWRSDEQEERPNRVFDMRLAKEGNVAELKPGQLVHRLFAILNSDYYRPFRMGEIYSKLFPNDYFCPFSSPDRIYQLVKRLRQWLAKSGIPIQVVEKDGDYALASEEPYGIKVYKEKVGKPSQLVVFLRLKQEWGERLFSARELSEFAEFSHSKANTLIAWAVDHGFLEKVGSGPRIKYRLCAADESPLAA